MLKKIFIQSFLFFAVSMFLILNVYAARIKDIANIKGVRQNQLVGYGLIVGLDGTGDGKKAEFTIQSMARMLEKMGIKTNDKVAILSANMPNWGVAYFAIMQ